MIPPALPEGDAPPLDGALPSSAVDGAGERAFGVYVHVPFCATRCGYCDFNTYTAAELGGIPGGPATPLGYAAAAAAEIRFAADVLARSGLPSRQASTVFVGGGTPTLLPAADLVALLDAVRAGFGLAAGAEVTTEANPDSVTPASLQALAEGGFTRVSVGMQSAVPEVLVTLDRTHDPANVPRAVRWARDAGLAVSLDLIYGTPGETDESWRTSLDAAVACEPDHVSAYALVVEAGTAMATRVRRGLLPAPDPDAAASRYETADDVLTAAGFAWYEVSNWATGPEHACGHNLGYWRGDDWWGAGPGAHSHVGGVRWWNVKHPAAYARRLASGSPAAGREVLDAEARCTEQVMLAVRTRAGLAAETVPDGGRARLAALVADGLVDGDALARGSVVLTRRGRLLADAVVRDLLGW